MVNWVCFLNFLFPSFLILLCQWMATALYFLTPLKDPGEIAQVFSPAFTVHRMYTVFIARQCVALPRMRKLLCFALSD